METRKGAVAPARNTAARAEVMLRRALARIRPLMAVIDAEGTRLGTVVGIEGRRLLIANPLGAVPLDQIAAVDEARVRLRASGARVPLRPR